MRFFTPSIPAGRLEYFGVLIITTIALYAIVFAVLEIRVDQLTGQVAYSADRLAFGLFLYLIWFTISIINVLRRITDLGISSAWAFTLLIPILGMLFSFYLLLASGVKRTTYAPYGDDPLNPDSWVAKPTADSTGPAVTYNGQALYLPGEHDAWDENAA